MSWPDAEGNGKSIGATENIKQDRPVLVFGEANLFYGLTGQLNKYQFSL